MTIKTVHSFLIISLLTLLFFGCSRLVVLEQHISNIPNWPQLGGSPARTNFSAQKLQLPIELLWDRRASSTIGPTLVAANGVVFYGTLDGRIEAVEIKTGKSRGKIKTRRDTESTCAYWRSALLVVRRIGQYSLSVVDLSNGNTVWQEKVGIILTEPLVTEDAVYVASLNGTLSKLDALTGTKRWSFDVESQIHSSPAYADGLVVFGNDAGEICAISADDGTEKWRFSTGSAVVAAAMISSGTVFFGSTDKRFYALRLSDGQEIWHFDAGGKFYNGAAAVDSLILFGSTDHFLYCVNAKSGKLLWKFEAASVIGTNPVVAKDVVFFGSLDHVLHAVNVQNGEELWSFELDGRIRTSPIIANGCLLAASEDDFLYCFGLK